jgi:hypothetical protein
LEKGTGLEKLVEKACGKGDAAHCLFKGKELRNRFSFLRLPRFSAFVPVSPPSLVLFAAQIETMSCVPFLSLFNRSGSEQHSLFEPFGVALASLICSSSPPCAPTNPRPQQIFFQCAHPTDQHGDVSSMSVFRRIEKRNRHKATNVPISQLGPVFDEFTLTR